MTMRLVGDEVAFADLVGKGREATRAQVPLARRESRPPVNAISLERGIVSEFGMQTGYSLLHSQGDHFDREVGLRSSLEIS
jgi:hypothetical protein